MKFTILIFLVSPALLAMLVGCSNLGYYLDSVRGQMNVWQSAQPIVAVLESPQTQASVKLKLTTVLKIREFASRELHLPDNRSYRDYADLKRPYVIWNVFATAEFSIEPQEWCFAFAGCVNYRGYFSKEDAQQFAAGLRKQGYDVYVGGVSAYSTLGWFNDPVLNTFINYPDTELARLIFHELAHQVTYVRDDSTFNESFAVTVEQEGMRRWLAQVGTAEQRTAFAAAEHRKKGFITLIQKARSDLEKTYVSLLSDAEKRTAKAHIFQGLQQEYQQLKITWGGFSRFDQWFDQDLTNAHLASVAIYTQLVPAFDKLLAENNDDLPRFYEAVKKLGGLPKDVRIARLHELQGDGLNVSGTYKKSLPP
ncbi:MAG: aminopeptidase [Gammaproteobacteria bacterium]